MPTGIISGEHCRSDRPLLSVAFESDATNERLPWGEMFPGYPRTAGCSFANAGTSDPPETVPRTILNNSFAAWAVEQTRPDSFKERVINQSATEITTATQT